MEINERIAYMWLGHMKTFKAGEREKLINMYGDAVAAYEMLHSDNELMRLKEGHILKNTTIEEIKKTDTLHWYEQLILNMHKTSVKCTTPADPDYPEKLREIPDYPVALYYRGDIGLTDSLAVIGVVGSRRPTHYGIVMAEEFCGSLARKNICIVSGMAMGIDSIAHRSALESGGKTIAVLGGGVDICYPRTNFDIYERICEEQLIISEYEPGESHQSIHFPLRNRIISGLSDGVLVVEAALRSGTLITADFALSQGRNVYAIPGRITDVMSKGTNGLIRQGAMPVDSPIDILLDVLGEKVVMHKGAAKKNATNAACDTSGALTSGMPSYEIKNDTSSNTEKNTSSNTEKNTSSGTSNSKSGNTSGRKSDIKKLTEIQRKLMDMMGYEPIYIDDLIRANDMKITETIRELKTLEREGFIESLEQSYFRLKSIISCN